MFLQNLYHISEYKVFVHKEIEEAKHEAVLVFEPELRIAVLLVLLLKETPFDNFAKNFRFVAEVLKEVSELAGHLEIGFFLLDYVLPIDFDYLGTVHFRSSLSAKQERISIRCRRSLAHMREVEHLAVKHMDHLPRILHQSMDQRHLFGAGPLPLKGLQPTHVLLLDQPTLQKSGQTVRCLKQGDAVLGLEGPKLTREWPRFIFFAVVGRVSF